MLDAIALNRRNVFAWGSIAAAVGTKSADECRSHYTACYTSARPSWLSTRAASSGAAFSGAAVRDNVKSDEKASKVSGIADRESGPVGSPQELAELCSPGAKATSWSTALLTANMSVYEESLASANAALADALTQARKEAAELRKELCALPKEGDDAV